MSELQIPDYMTNRPVSISDLADSAMRRQESSQNQRINEMKMAEYQQSEPVRRQLQQAQAQDESTKAAAGKQKIIGNLAGNVLGQLDKSGITDPQQRQQFITQAIDAHKPYLQGVLQLPVNDYMSEDQLRSLSKSASGGEYHPPVATSEGYLQFDNGAFAPMLNPQGKPYMPGAVDVSNKFDIGMAGSLSKLVEQGYMDLPTAQSILNNQVMGQGQQQQPMQQEQAPPVFIDQNMSPEDQETAQQDYNTYKSNVAKQNQQGIPTAGQREIEKVDIANQGKAFENEEKLANKYQGESKAFRDLSDAYQKTNVLFDKAKDSAPATLAAATAYMKLLDPGSVVRESELGMALNATGKLDKAANYMNRISKGEVLTDSQIKLFKEATKDVYKAATKQQRLIDKNYKEVALRNKLNPKNVIQDVGQYGVYSSKEEVKAAVANGDLELDDGHEILRNKFGLE